MHIAALCHDLGHRGKNNIFEINTLSEIAVRYHDESVLEQYHTALTIELLLKPSYNIAESLSSDRFKILRKIITQCILATDMKDHFDMIKEVDNRAAQLAEENSGGLTPEDMVLAARLCTHLSDLSGSVKEIKLSKRWSKMILQEFSEQVYLV